MRTAIYTRVSTIEQAQEGFSLPAQLERLRAYCASQDWEVADIYTDEGESAKSTDRPELQRLLKDIETKKIDIVLVYRLDRLTRSVLDLYELLKVFDRNDVGFKSATEVFDTTTAMGRLFITIVAALAQWERENLAERVRFGSRQKAMTGQLVTPKALFGYKLVDGKLVINDDEAEIIHEIFNRYVSGEGMMRLLKWLNNSESPVPGRKFSHWTSSGLSYVLQNPFYAGFIRYDYISDAETIIVKGTHDPIIQEPVFQRALEIRKGRQGKGRTGTGDFPLSGLLFCHCGAPMYGHKGAKYKGKYHRYYHCSHAKIFLCNTKYQRADNIENNFINKISEITRDLSEKSEMRNTKATKPDTERLLKIIEGKKKRLWDAYEAGLSPLDELKDRLQKLNAEEEKLKLVVPEIDLEEQRKALLQSLNNVRDLWETVTALERKELARMIVERIDWLEDGDLSITLRK